MNANDLLDAFEEVNDRHIQTAQRYRERKKSRGGRSKLKILLIAAVISVLLTGCAAAVAWRLQNLNLGKITYVPSTSDHEKAWDVISMQGYEGSPGYLAAKEWMAFLTTYDEGGELLNAARYHDYEPPEIYAAYGCYTPEMADKVDEICAKYGLTPHGRLWSVLDIDIEKIFEATGIDDIRAAGVQDAFWMRNGSCYDDGSFVIRGNVQFQNREREDRFQMYCVKKGSFSYFTKFIADVDEFVQWDYTMGDGTPLLLAADADTVLMIADQKDYFITAELFAQESLPEDPAARKDQAEAMAEYFCFGIQPGRTNPEIMEETRRSMEEMQAQSEWLREQAYNRADYQAYLNDNRSYLEEEHAQYLLLDLDGDGCEELILQLENSIDRILTINDGQTARVTESSGEGQMWISDGHILVKHRQCGECQEYAFCRMENGEMRVFDLVEFHGESGKWNREQEGIRTEISESEAMELIAAHPCTELDWKPVADF